MKKPFSVTFGLVAVCILGSINLWRAVALPQYGELLSGLSFSLPWGWLSLLAAFWAVVWFFLAGLLWRRQSLARYLIPMSGVGYAFYKLLLTQWLTPDPVAYNQNWISFALFIIGAIGLFFWWRRPTIQTYFNPVASSRGRFANIIRGIHD